MYTSSVISSCRLIRRGHSLVEVLTVVAMIVALVAILMPMLSAGKRNAYTSVCMSNLQELSKAHQGVMVRAQSDEADRARMGISTNWPSIIYDKHSLGEKLRCPEAGDTKQEDTALDPLMIAMTLKGDFDKVQYYQTLSPDDPWVRKLSWTQWLTATGGSGEFLKGDFGHFFKKKYTGYVEDEEPDRYVLMVEDYSGIVSGKWVNYTDFIIFVDKDPDNPANIMVNAQHGYDGSKDKGFLVWSDNKKAVHEPIMHLTRGDSREISLMNAPGHYGANPKQLFSPSAKDHRILFLDYEESLATPHNWEDHYDDDGKLKFVRHMNDTLNVARVDGSVTQSKEEDIRLSQYSKETLHW